MLTNYLRGCAVLAALAACAAPVARDDADPPPPVGAPGGAPTATSTAAAGGATPEGGSGASETPYVPCTGNPDEFEGKPCTLCDPEDADCVEPPGEKHCRSDGACVAAQYHPCDGKKCGEACTLCDPLFPNCIEPPGELFCSGDSFGGVTCKMAPAVCECPGKSCGDTCESPIYGLGFCVDDLGYSCWPDAPHCP